MRTECNYKEQISANHFPKQSKVEFKFDGNNPNKDMLQEKAQVIISEGRKVTEDYDQNGLRCITIDGLPSEPCSGTHVSDTSQIGEYGIRKLEVRKGRLVVGYNAQYFYSKPKSDFVK